MTSLQISFKKLIFHQRCILRVSRSDICKKTVSINATGADPQKNLSSTEKVKPFEEIPKIHEIPIFKASWNYFPIVGKYDMKKFQDTAFKKYEEYGNIIYENIGFGFKMVHVYDPKDIQTVLRNEGRYPNRMGLSALTTYKRMKKDQYRDGILVSNGKAWYDTRSKVQKHLLKPKIVQAFLPDVNKIADDMVRNITQLRHSDGEVDNFLQELYRWALESIALVALDRRLGCLELGLSEDAESMQMIRAVMDVIQSLSKFEFGLKLWKIFPTPRWRRFEKHMDEIINVSKKYITEVKSKATTDKELTFMEILLHEEKLDPAEAFTMVTDMLMAGIESTSTTLGLVLYTLAKNQNAQEAAHQEICKHLKKSTDPITPEILNDLRFMKACVKETLRVMPVISGNVRTLEEDVILSGYKVPSGTMVLMSNGVAGQLEENFSRPDEFLPERWLGEKESSYNPFVFLPFGFGPRSCVGRRIAEQEIWTLLAKILQKFHLEYHHEDIKLVTTLVNVPDRPLKISFVDR